MKTGVLRGTPLVELEGDPYEMGLQYGKTCRSAIRSAVVTSGRIGHFYTRLTPKQCTLAVARFRPYLEEKVPRLCDEIRGVAEGSGFSYDEMLAYQFHGRDLTGPGGCTMVHVAPRDPRQEAVTGQTVDWTPSLEPYYHVVIRRPSKGFDTVQFTLAGIMGLIGKNESGMSVFMNILLTSESVNIGIPAYLMLRLLMEQSSPDDGLLVLREMRRTSPFNFMIAGDGRAYNIESSASHLQITNIGHRDYVHTNHCLRKPMALTDMYTKIVQSDETLHRYSRMRRLLKESVGVPGPDVSSLFSLLKDHEDYPDSICRHARTDLPADGRMKTLGAVLSRDNENGIWVARGNPCESKLEFFGL